MKRLISLCLIGLFVNATSKTNAKIKAQLGDLNNATNSSAHYKVVDYNFGVKNDSLILPWMNNQPTIKVPQKEATFLNATKK